MNPTLAKSKLILSKIGPKECLCANTSSSQSCSLLDNVFQAAVERFASDMTQDPRKIATAESATCLEEVQEIVAESMAKYESDRKHWKAKRWLQSVAGKLEYYQNVMDMLVQHHPEYVALAWGAMKFLLLVSNSLRSD